jgi:hypothetical protein
MFFVKLAGDPDEAPPFKIPKSRLLPDVFGGVLDRGDADDVVRANFAANNKLVADHHSKNFLDVVTELGEYTAVLDSIFGHQDSFTHTDGALLENKASFPQGSPDTSVKMEGFVASGSVPSGALAYPKYKIATLSFALSEVELHYLDKDLHCSPRQMHQEDADKRSPKPRRVSSTGEASRTGATGISNRVASSTLLASAKVSRGVPRRALIYHAEGSSLSLIAPESPG